MTKVNTDNLNEFDNRWCHVVYNNGCGDVLKISVTQDGIFAKEYGRGDCKYKLNLDKIKNIEIDEYMEMLMEGLK